MKRYLVFGGSKGLGSEICSILSSDNHEVINCSRSNPCNESIHEFFDLISADKHTFYDLFERFWPIHGLIFSQRYRDSTNSSNYLDEYKVTVESIGLALDAFIEFTNDIKLKLFTTRVIIIGSSYTSSAGYDQNWSYHSTKHAQIGILRYFSVNGNGTFNINVISPPAYVRRGAEEYWSKNEKSSIWRNYPSQTLPTIQEVATIVVNILYHSSVFFSGNNIMTDSGVCNLYPDQRNGNHK